MLLGVDNVGGIRLDARKRALQGLQRLANWRRRGPVAAPHLSTGMDGEQEAYFHLRRLGYTIVARRWRTAKLRGDLDMIGWQAGCLCFVEVKTRTRRDLVPAEFQVDEEKQRMLHRMAAAYLRRFPEDERRAMATRFDVVSVYLERGKAAAFDVLAGAFE